MANVPRFLGAGLRATLAVFLAFLTFAGLAILAVLRGLPRRVLGAATMPNRSKVASIWVRASR
jgi:hypothetical protein